MSKVCLPCRRAGARRLPAARARTQSWHRCGAGVGLLLLLPVIGLACAAPPVSVIFSLPLFLEIPLLQWQARSMATEHDVLKPIALLPLRGRMAEVRCVAGYFHVFGTNNHHEAEAFSESIYIFVWTQHFDSDAGSAVARSGVITFVAYALATGGALRAFCLCTYGIILVAIARACLDSVQPCYTKTLRHTLRHKVYRISGPFVCFICLSFPEKFTVSQVPASVSFVCFKLACRMKTLRPTLV